MCGWGLNGCVRLVADSSLPDTYVVPKDWPVLCRNLRAFEIDVLFCVKVMQVSFWAAIEFFFALKGNASAITIGIYLMLYYTIAIIKSSENISVLLINCTSLPSKLLSVQTTIVSTNKQFSTYPSVFRSSIDMTDNSALGVLLHVYRRS